MKWIAIIGGGLIALILGALLIVPSLVPSETYQTAIQEQLSRELDREVRIEGDVSLSTFPVIKAKTGRATIANPPGYSRDLMASIEGLEARIKLWPLLSRRVEIAGFTLQQPDILLERRADGEANWVIEAYAANEAPTDTDEPFKRDGRYSNIDPSLAMMRIENGRLTYNDIPADRSVDLSAINIGLALPNMAETMMVEGDLAVDGESLALDLSLDSPRAFLDGQAASIKGQVETKAGRVDLDGRFPASEAIAFEGEISADISDLPFFERFLPEPVPALSLIDSVTLDATTRSDGTVTIAERLEASLEGEELSASFNGDARHDGTLSLSGNYEMEAGNVAKVGRILAPDVTGLDAIESVQSKGQVSVNGSDVSVSGMTLDATGPQLEASVSGDFARSGEMLNGRGRFKATSSDAATLARAFLPDLTQDADVVGRMDADGNINLSGNRITISDLTAKTQSDAATGTYTGSVTLEGDSQSLGGRLEATVPSLDRLNSVLTTEIPYASSVGRADVTASLSGSTANLSLTDIVATLSEGDLNGSYRGSASVSDASTLNGQLDVSSESLRRIANAAEIDLPPSTDAGPIFEGFSLRGAVSGPVDNITLADAALALDALSGTGRFGIDLRGERPMMTGQIAMSAVDLRPYMNAYSAARPQGAVQAWSEEPLPTEGLRAVDVDLSLTAPSIQLPQLTLGQTQADVTLRDGRLVTDIPAFNLYGGSGSGQLVFNAQNATPSFSLDATLDRLQTGNFLSAVAGFTQVEGTGATTVALRGSGNSQAAIIRSLSGNGDFMLSDGLIRGIDASEFMSGLQQALTSRTLPGGIGEGKTTEYRLINGRYDMSNGVATLGQFSLTASDVAVTGSGQVDLGDQTIDFRLRPRAVGTQTSSLASFGIPIRFRGPFGAAKPQLDSEFLGEILQARAASEAQRLITGAIGGNREGGSAGTNLLGSILGSTQQRTETETPPEPQAGVTQETAQEPEETKPEDVLLELFGVRKRQEGNE